MPDPQELQELVERVAGQVRGRRLSVAVVGDIILDHAIEGVPGGRHPDIGVAILKDAHAQESIGGAGNIALILARLGVNVALFGVIGSDLPGRQLECLLDRQPFADYLITEKGWPTPRKDWIYQRQDNRRWLLQRIDYDKPLPGRGRAELAGEFRARCPERVDIAILVDHSLGSIGPESLELIDLAKDRGAKIVAIPRSTALRGQAVDAMVINSPEMRGMSDADASADPRSLAAEYAQVHGHHVFLTMLSDGILVCPGSQAGPGTQIPGYPLENAHWMGARDMATALVALGMALDLDPIETGRLANAFRHLIACQWGNGRVFWRDIFQFVGLPI
jgi:D-beta-D-heptose 7-phosphate kinase/D-beta-D-heptose 1-phosphate adenosyltransferase